MIKFISSAVIILLLFVCISVSEQPFITLDSIAVESSKSHTNAEAELLELRNEIDIINQDILKLLNKRAEVVLEIGKLKKENSMEIYDPAREKEIENRLIELNTGPMPNESVLEIFRQIISACRLLQ